MDDDLIQAIEILRNAGSILVFTGAGISTGSGIPDFRGPDGVWTKVDPSEFTYDKYLRNPETRKRSWQMRFGSGILEASPNPAHTALVDLWVSGRLRGCVTQNIDGLHAVAGLPREALVEVHGNAHNTRCLDCRRTWPTTEIAERVGGGDDDPHCEHCGGILKVTVISFGENMPADEMDRAFAMAEDSDAVISIGSTLSVYPAAYVPLESVKLGAPYIIVNRGPTDHDRLCDVKIEADVATAVPAIVSAVTAT